ncbi:MAG: hypothetical protein ABW061_05015 [Polyangiaceae bacterium]
MNVLQHRSALAFVVSVAFSAFGCSKPSDSGKPSASANAASASSPPPTASLAVPPPVLSKPGCRALDVTGRATLDGAPLATNAFLNGEQWVELEAGASVSLRHTQTTREFKLIGPGRVLPCRAGAEQLLLAVGQLTTSANLGVRPGAEVLIATPLGTIRYGDAALDVEVGDKGQRVRVKQGAAWVEPQAQGKPHFENPVRNGSEARLPARHTPIRELISACQAAAGEASKSAQHVLERDPDAGAGSLGERAAAHMRERGKARMACAIAAAALGTSSAPGSDQSERQSLSATVAHADELWQSVPRAIPGQKN